MLEPRESDVPALFLVLVVLPLVVYILLGRWGNDVQTKARINAPTQIPGEEAVDDITTVALSSSEVRSLPKSEVHKCARCFAPARTRCSRCKSVRYCSGNCQIIHWRQCHKLVCKQWDGQSTFPFVDVSNAESIHQGFFQNGDVMPSLDGSRNASLNHLDAAGVSIAVNASLNHTTVENHPDKRIQKFSKVKRNDDASSVVSGKYSTSQPAPLFQSQEIPVKDKFFHLGTDTHVSFSNEGHHKQNTSTYPISTRGPPYRLQHSNESFLEQSKGYNKWATSYTQISESSLCENQITAVPAGSTCMKGENLTSYGGKLLDQENPKYDSSCCSLHPDVSVAQRSARASRHYPCSALDIHHANTFQPAQAPINSAISELGDTKFMHVKKLTELSRLDNTRPTGHLAKIKVLFPYEDFIQLFSSEVWNLYPRGLLNCGNSCYANAVLQCLTSTKPLIAYLLQKSHSKNCQAREWCLTCELEQHVSMLGEGGGPLSPYRILLHMRSIGCRMGAGNQEDAHEFLRLLVASMQAICLEELGSEKEIDPRMQETTFIQHTFGGRLKSKVKCLKCQHESERYENIMDVTLEILGWVESLEDALTQFTSPEDLDGENMYKCGRCGTYVKARKQLRIHEAPNILTVVLKRFQTGMYGKINKCVIFPEMLDLIPFMTRNGDSPPMYLLYGVVVHLDTLNASYSGHYVAYIKDPQGMWFRIDDTEVEPVPMSQVMSESAYILFYLRSYPRPPRVYRNGKISTVHNHATARHSSSKIEKSRHRPSSNGTSLSVWCPSLEWSHIARPQPYSSKSFGRQQFSDHSDSTASDWSLFTSSDESSYTSESTQNSTVDGLQ